MKLTKIKKMKIRDLKRLAKKLEYDLPKKSKKQDYIDYFINDLSNNYLTPILQTNSKSIDFVTYGKRIKAAF